MTVASLRSALATAVATTTVGSGTLRTSDRIVDNINPPMAVVFRNDVTYDLDMGGATANDTGNVYNFVVVVYAGRTAEAAAQTLLDNLVEPTGTGSIRTAIESNAALRAACAWVNVKSASAVKVATVGAIDYLITEFAVEIEL